MKKLRSSVLKREELVELYKYSDTQINNELNLFFQYYNFYIGLMSAILGGTLTGLFSIGKGDILVLTLLIGPIMIVVLSVIGYSNISVFYRRFAEAWTTKLNIESMLRYNDPSIIGKEISDPIFKSYVGSFITQVQWAPFVKILSQAKKEGWTAETLAEKLTQLGSRISVLASAKRTFIWFCVLGIFLAVAIILTAFS